MADNELWKDISIMSADEMESSMGGESPSTEEEVSDASEENQEGEREDNSNNEEFTITEPDSTESSENFENNESPKEPSKDQSEEKRQKELNKYGALIKDLQQEGVLTGVEGDELEEKLQDASIDTIKELMKETVDDAFKAKESQWKKSFSGSKKRFLEIEDSFDDTDQAIQMAQRLDYLDSIDENTISENETLQKQLYAEHLRSKNFSDEEIAESLEEAEAIDKLGEKAKRALPALREQANTVVEQSKEQKIKRQEEMAQQYEEQYNKLMENIDSKDEFIPGLKLNKTVKEKIKENITAPVHKDEEGKEYTSLMYKQKRNPSEFQMLINYYDSIGLFNLGKEGNFKPDVSKLKNVAKTKATNELDKVLAREEQQGVGRRNSDSTSSQTESVLDFFEEAFKKKKK